MIHAIVLAAILLIGVTAKMTADAPQASSETPVVAAYSGAGDP